MKNLSHNQRWACGFFFLALSVRLLFFAAGLSRGEETFAPAINEDAGQYVTLARNLLAGHGFSRDTAPPYRPDFFRTPGYPAFLAAIFAIQNSLWSAVLIQLMISSAAPVLLFYLARRFLPGLWSAIPPLILVFEPATAYWSTQLTTESFFTAVLLVAVFYLFNFAKTGRLGFAFLSGLLFGFAVLTRPGGQVLSLLFFISLVPLIQKEWRRGLLAVLLVVIGIFSITAPWRVRNQRIFGAFELSTVGSSIGLGKYLSAYTYAKRQLSIIEVYPDIVSLEKTNPFASSRAIKFYAARAFLRDPLPFVTLAATSAFPFFLGDGWGTAFNFLLNNGEAQAQREWGGSFSSLIKNPTMFGTSGSLFWIGKLFWGGICAVAVFGILGALRDRKKRWDSLFLVLIIAATAISSGVGSYSRFRQPVNPYIFLFAVIGIKQTISLFKKFYPSCIHRSGAG